MSDNFPIFEPDTKVSARKVFDVDFGADIPAFSASRANTPRPLTRATALTLKPRRRF